MNEEKEKKRKKKRKEKRKEKKRDNTDVRYLITIYGFDFPRRRGEQQQHQL